MIKPRLRDFKNLNRMLVTQAVRDFAEKLPAGQRLLDVGAGSGNYRTHFTRQQYISIDRGYESASMKGLDVFGDIMTMPFPEKSMDAAICIEVLEHMPETRRFLTELARVMKPASQLLLTTPLCFGEHMGPYDFYRFTRYGLKRCALENGFSVEHIEPRGGFFVLAAYLLGRLPDEVARSTGSGIARRLAKPILRMVSTYLLAPMLYAMDGLDKEKRFTLGYTAILRRQ
jgi:2-polyprenyl-3-methyl-5-hydroxy-6-metoxy-1,4-benzoquinol methylase